MPKRILVVDDDKEVQEIITFVLRCNGFDVLNAYNGLQMQEQLKFHLACPLDLIILDVMMPGEDGYRICRALRENPRTSCIPVMIITAHAEDIYERISIDVGAVLHMTKPFHPLELAEKVKALLNRDCR
jgi:DNA-binding response OmpR family regulator